MKNIKHLTICAFILFSFTALTQQTEQKKSFSITKVNTISPKSIKNDNYGAQLVNIEQPSPNGSSYRSFLMQQKILAKTYWEANKKTSPTKTGERNTPQPIIESDGFIPTRKLSNGSIQTLIGGIPSDNTSAISKDGIVVACINSHVYAYDTKTNTPVFESHNITLSNMYSSTPTLGSFYDPKVLYDPIQDRFILTFLKDSSPSTSRIIMCFSSTNNPADPWYVYELPGNPLDNNRWTDFPCLSITANKVYYTANLIIPDVSWQVGFDGSVIWEMDKAAAFEGATDISATLFYDIKYDNKFVRNLHPVNGTDGTASELVLLSNRNFDISNDTIFYVHLVDEAIQVEALTTNVSYGVPPNARQSDTNTDDPTLGLQTNDARVLGAIMFEDEIQFVGNTVDPNTGFSAIYHGRITWQDGLAVTGNIISDEVRDFAYPNIAWSGNELCDREVIINFLYSAPTVFPGAATVFVDNDRNTSEVLVIREGDNIVDRLPGGYERWGDYTGLQRIFDQPGSVFSFTYHVLSDERNTGFGVQLGSPDSSKLALTFSLNSDLQVCNNYITASPSGGIPPYELYWDSLTSPSSDSYGPFCVDEEIECTVIDARGCTATAKFSPEFSDEIGDFIVFPNPSSDYAVVLFKVTGTPVIRAKLFDNAGNLVDILLEQNANQGMNQLVFTMESLAQGLYHIVIYANDDKIHEQKIIKTP